MHPTWLVGLLAALTASVAPLQAAELLLVGGTVYRGDGSPGESLTVVVDDGEISQIDAAELVGPLPARRNAESSPAVIDGTVIDCTGLVVAPGFIDLHNHSDAAIETVLASESGGDADSVRTPRVLADGTRRSVCYLTQGCTTIVTGNCGGGALDVADYYARLGERPSGVNVAHLIPQGAVREAVIGNTRRAPADGELDAMRDLVRAGMEAGAWGMTTGLQYVPSAYADTPEIAALARVVAEYGGVYASHIRDEGDGLVESVEEAILIGRRSGAAVHVSHFKASKRRNWGKVRAAAAVIEAARAEGHTVTADQYPYAASGTSVAAMLLPDEEREGSRDDLSRRLADPTELARLRPIIAETLEARGAILVADCPAYPLWVGRRLREIAAAEGRDPTDIAIDVIRSGDESGVSFSMDERDVRWVMTQPWVATASDGSVKVDDGTKPHPRSYGTFPRRIGRYAIAEGVVPLEQAIRSATGLPADILGMTDRGYLRVGQVADLVVFDPATLRDHATFESPHQLSTGVRWLLVNGELAIADGEVVSTTAGRPLRKPMASAVEGG